jgi:hypothetical protein
LVAKFAGDGRVDYYFDVAGVRKVAAALPRLAKFKLLELQMTRRPLVMPLRPEKTLTQLNGLFVSSQK